MLIIRMNSSKSQRGYQARNIIRRRCLNGVQNLTNVKILTPINDNAPYNNNDNNNGKPPQKTAA